MIAGCEFRENTAADWASGGAVYVRSSGNGAKVAGCTFVRNYAENDGGAVTFEGALADLVNCTFYGNTTTFYGGAICARGASPALTNCLFAGNEASGTSGSGGAVYAESNSLSTITNCTFASNSAWQGNAVACASGTATISNSILWDSGDEVYDVGGQSTITVSHSDVQGGYAGTGNISADPSFARSPNPGPDAQWGTSDDDYGDLRLFPLSPCIDAGDNAPVLCWPALDLGGAPRQIDDPVVSDCRWAIETCGTAPIVDMGAYEHVCHCPPSDVDGDGDVDLVDFQTFQACYAGPNRPYNSQDPQCYCLDYDHDADVDLVDFLVFQGCFNGANQPPAAGCEYGGCGGTLSGMAMGGSSQSSTPPTPPYQGGEAAVAGVVSSGVTVSAGSIDTSALPPGRYVLLMRPTGAAVLRTDVALNTDLVGNFATRARVVSGETVIAFEIAK